MAEKASWHAETRALDIVREREIAAGTRPKGVWDMDVGYHQELEAANKRLEMDNRLMAPRVSTVSFQEQTASLIQSHSWPTLRARSTNWYTSSVT
jgi:hypothetical protein